MSRQPSRRASCCRSRRSGRRAKMRSTIGCAAPWISAAGASAAAL